MSYLDEFLDENGDNKKKKKEEEVSYLDEFLSDEAVDYDPEFESETFKDRAGEQLLQQGEQEFKGVDLEEYTDYTGADINLTYDDVEEQRAQAQSWGEKAFKGVGRAGAKAATEIAKMPGYIGGAADWASTGFDLGEFGRFVDNAWINSIEEFAEDLNEEVLPVYTRRAVQEGNLWDNITSVDFWATDGADGVGFLASMFVPGMAIKALGTGAKVARGINSLGNHYNFTKTMSLGAKAANKIDNGSAVLLNTVFEAGAEASGVVDGLKKDMAEKVKAGELTEQEAARIAGEAGRNTFLTNLAILVGPNAMMHKNLFGKFMPGKTLASKLTDEAGELLTKATAKTAGQRVGDYAKAIGTGFVSEGVIEEAGQFAAEEHFKAVAKGERENTFEDYLDSYADAWTETEGQKAIFLGAFLGGGMSSIGTYREGKTEEESTNKILKLLKENYSQFEGNLTDIYKKNPETGEIIKDEYGKPVKDFKKAAEIFESIKKGVVATRQLETYAQQGNKEGYEFAYNENLTRFIMPYVTMDGGMELLEKHVDALSDNVVNQLKEFDNLDVSMTAQDVKSSIMQKAQEVQKQVDYMEVYNNDFFKLTLPDSTSSKQKALRDLFVNHLQKAGVFNNSRQNHIKSRISKLQQEAMLMQDYGDGTMTGTELEEGSTESIQNKKIRGKIQKQIESYKRDLESLNEDAKDLFNKKKQQEAFEEFIRSSEDLSAITKLLEDAMENSEYPDSYLSNLYSKLTQKEKIEHEGVSKTALHSAEFDIKADGLDFADSPKFRISNRYSDGSLEVANVNKPSDRGVLRADGTLEFKGKVYSNATLDITQTVEETRMIAEGQARINVFESFIEMYKERLETYDAPIQRYLEYIDNIEVALNRALGNVSGTARVHVDGKLMSLNAAQLEFRLDLMKAKLESLQNDRVAVLDNITELERRRQEVIDAALVGKDFPMMSQYNDTIENIKDALTQTNDLIKTTEEAITAGERLLNNMKRMLKGAYTAFKNLFDTVYPQFAGYIENADLDSKRVTAGDLIRRGIAEGEISPDEVIDLMNEGDVDAFLENHTKFAQSSLKKYGINMADEFGSLTNEEALELVYSSMTSAQNLLDNPELSYASDMIDSRVNNLIAKAEEVKTLKEDLKNLKNKKKALEKELRRREATVREFNKQYNAILEANEIYEDEQVDTWLGEASPSIESDIERFQMEQEEMERQDREGVFGNRKSKEPRPPFRGVFSFFRTGGNQAVKTPESNRWYKFVESVQEFAKKDDKNYVLRAYSIETLPEELRDKVKFYVPSKKRLMTLAEIGNSKRLLKEASEDLKLVAVNHTTGEFYLDPTDKTPVYTSMPLATLTMPFKKDGKRVPRFSTELLILEKVSDARKAAKEANMKFGVKEAEEARETAEKEVFNEMEEARIQYEVIREGIKSEVKTFNITHKNPGKKNFPAKPGKPLTRIANKPYEFQWKSIRVALGQIMTVNDRVFPTHKGFAYVMHNGRPELLIQKTLDKTNDIERVIRLLQYYMSIKGNLPAAKAERIKISNQLQSIMYFNYPEEKAENISHRIYTRRKGQELVFGDQVLTANSLLAGQGIEELTAFLTTKYHHVNNKTIEKGGKYQTLDIVDGKVKVVKEYDNYKTYLLMEKMDVNLLPMGDPTTPQYENMSLGLEETTFSKPKSKPKKKETSKPKNKKEKPKKGKKTEAETAADDVASFQELMAAGASFIGGDKSDTKKDRKKNKKDTKNVESARAKESESQTLGGIPMPAKKTPEQLAAEAGLTVEEVKAQLAAENESLDEDDDYRLAVGEQGTINLTKEIEWFQKRFPEIPIDTVAGLINGKAHGVFKKNLTVLISDLAAKGTVYHEAFHVVSKVFLTKEESEALYNEIRENLGDKEVTLLDGKTVKGKFLTNDQAEEYLAEEFREYMLSDGNYNFPQKEEQKKGFFKTLFDMIVNFYNTLRGRKNKAPYSIEEVFKGIESGQEFVLANRKGQPLQDFNRIGKLSEALSTQLLNDMNLRFFRQLFNNKAGLFGADVLFNFDNNLDKIYGAVKISMLDKDMNVKPRFALQYKYFDEIKEEHKRFLRQYNVHVRENAEEDIKVKNSEVHIESNQTSVNDLMARPVKILIAGLPQIFVQEGKYKLKTFGDFNTASTVKFNKTVNLLNNTLAKSTSYKEMVSRIAKLTDTHPEFSVLLDWLGSTPVQEITDSVDTYNERLQTMFFNQFSKNKNIPLLGILKEDGVLTFNDAVENSLRKVVLDKWKNNVKSDYESTFFDFKKGRLVLDLDKELELPSGQTFSVRNFKVNDIKRGKYSKSDMIAILYGFGIDVTDIEDNIKSKSMLAESIYWLMDRKDVTLREKEALEPDDFFNRDAVAINKEINNLASLVASSLDEDVELQYFNQEGKLEYSITLNSHLSNTVNSLNNQEDEVAQDKMSHLNPYDVVENPTGNIFTVGSKWLKRVAKDKLELVLLRGLTPDKGNGLDASKLEHSDFAALSFNSVLRGYFPYLRSADRKLEYAFKFGTNRNPETGEDMRQVDISRSIKSSAKDFMPYLIDELATVAALTKDGVGANLKNYKDLGQDLRFFKDIVDIDIAKFKQFVKKQKHTDYTKMANEFMDSKLTNKALTGITKYLRTATRNNEKALLDNGIVELVGKDTYEGQTSDIYKIYGIDPEIIYDILGVDITENTEDGTTSDFITEYQLRKLTELFTIQYTEGAIEQTKLFTGDTAMYKSITDFHKRTTGGASTRNNTRTGKEYNELLNKLYPRFNGTYKDHFNKIVYKDVMVDSQYLSQYKSVLPESLWKYYTSEEQTESDAQARLTLDSYRELMIKNGKWSDAAEKTYQFEMQSLVNRLIGLGTATKEDFVNIYGEHTNGKYTTTPMFKGEAIKMSELEALPPLKPQGFGNIKNVDNLFATDFTKISASPIIPSVIPTKSPMFTHLMDMYNNNIDISVFESGEKGTIHSDVDNFYDEDGNINPINPEVISEMSLNDFGLQLDIDPEGKQKTTLSTQKERLEFIDIFGELSKEEMPKVEALKDEKNSIKNALVKKNREALLKKLGIKETSPGKFELENPNGSKFRDTLIEAFQERRMPYNVEEGLNMVMNSSLKLFDTLITKGNIESVLMGLIRNKVIKTKVNGGMYVQESSTGLEFNKREGEIKTSNYLNFYHKDKKGNTVPMEVEIPLPKAWIPWVETRVSYRGRKGLEALNLLIKDGKFDERLLRFSGNRIPGQALNSLESMRVVRFLPTHAGQKIVLPTEIVTKSGSDFDIDKLTLYLPNFTITDAGGPKYIEYSESEEDLVRRYQAAKKGQENFMSLKDFGTLPLEEQNSTKALENRMNEIANEVILHPKNFSQLIRPQTADTLKRLANELGEKQDVTLANLHEWWYNMQVAENNWAGVAGVGQSALHTTSHATTQQSPVTVVDENFDLFFDGQQSDELPYMGHTKDSEGNYISSNFGEFLTAFVDIAKDPFIFRLNAGTRVFNSYATLQRISRTTPVGLETLANFFTQPIILDYIKQKSVNAAMFRQNKGKRSDRDIVESLITKYGGTREYDELLGVQYRNYIDADNTTVDKATGKTLKNSLSDKYKNSKKAYRYKNLSLKDLQSSRKNKTNQVQILDNFLQYQVYARKLGSFQRVTKPEVNIGSNRASVKLVQKEMEELRASEFFADFDIDTFLNSTMLREHNNTQENVINIFRDFFLIDREDSLSNIFDTILEKMSSTISDLSPQKAANVMARVENMMVDYILHTSKGTEKALNKQYKKLITGKNSVAKQFLKVKTVLGTGTNPLIDELIAILDEFLLTRGRNTGLDNVKLYNTRLQVEEQDSLVTSFKELFEHEAPAVRKFAHDLMKLSIVQSGMNQSNMAFSKVIPEEQFQPFAESLIEAYLMKNKFKDDAMISSIFKNSWSNSAIVPRESALYSFPSSRTGRLNWAPKITEKGEANVRKGTANADAAYISITHDAVPYKEAKKLRKQGKVVPKETSLLINTGQTKVLGKNEYEYSVFKVIDKWGEGRYFSEHYKSDTKSIIEANNVQEEDVKAVDKSEEGAKITPKKEDMASLRRSDVEVTPETVERLNTFLSTIGVNIETVTEILDRTGRATNAYGMARIAQKTVELVKGQEGLNALPEEAAHFYVAMLGRDNNLFKAMYNSIENYQIYEEVVKDYSEYYAENSDMLKLEAMGHLIANHINALATGQEYAPQLTERQQRQIKTWWNALVKFLKSMFGKTNSDPFVKSAYNMLSNNIQEVENPTPEIQDMPALVGRGRDNFERTTHWERIKEHKQRLKNQNKEMSNAELTEIVQEVDPIDNAREKMITDFDIYFPDYAAWMSAEEIEAFVDGMSRGDLEIYCGL